MSVNPTTFEPGPTRDVQPGDTPDLNDGLLSRNANTNVKINRGDACWIRSGTVTVADAFTGTDELAGFTPCVPVESVDNTGGSIGDLQINVVTAPQRVAMTFKSLSGGLVLNPGDYVKINDASAADGAFVARWIPATDDSRLKFARYLGKEAALLDKADSNPFDETLSVGIVPDQTIETQNPGETGVGWFQLLESQGGT